MGVSSTHYIILGAKITPQQLKAQMPPCPEDVCIEDWSCVFLEDYEDNGYQKKITSKNDLTSVYDGMCGEYVVIGKVLAKGVDGDGLPMTKAEYKQSDLLQIKNKIENHLGLKIDSDDIGLFVFTHWH